MALKVLVVDDSPTAALWSRMSLESQGFTVVMATDGSEALGLARGEHFDAILSDILMPNVDGFELVRAVRADPALSATPVLLNSATFHAIEDKAFLSDLDADGTLDKAEPPERMAAAILEAIVARQERSSRLPSAAILDEVAFSLEHRNRMLHHLLKGTAALEHSNVALAARVAELETVAVVSAALSAAMTRAEVMAALMDHLFVLLKAEGAALALADPVTGESVIEQATGQWQSWTGERLPAGEGLCGQTIASGQPLVDNNLQVDPLHARPEPASEARAVICVPLITQGQTIGVIWFGRPSGVDGFRETDLRLLNSMSNIAANAIHRTNLRQQTEQRLQRLFTLRAIDQTISGSVDLQFTLHSVLTQITSQLGVDAAGVLLLKPNAPLLEYAAGIGFKGPGYARSRVRLGDGYAGRAALERVTVCAADRTQAHGMIRSDLLAAEGFIAYYGVPLVAKGQVKGVLEIFHRAPLAPDSDWLDFLEMLAVQTAIAIDGAELFTNLWRSNIELTQAYDATIEGWSRALDLRDKETEGHSLRVTEITVRLAHAMGLNEAELVNIRRGALLHDMGKVGVADSILRKTGPLTDAEWVDMRQHPRFAYDMLAPIAYLRPALDIPYCHHEKWDGSGYPRHLKGEAIPLAARMFAVVDVYDALTSDRPYRPAWLKADALTYIHDQAGKHFDPAAVEAFLRLMAEET